jgi:uncharacterized membrane protein YdbT with pleckstrin-like domain
MRMQEPEQWQPSEQEWQADQEYGEYRAEYAGKYESEQKIYPQEKQGLRGTSSGLPGILAIFLSSIGFFLAVAGIAASAIVLKYPRGQQELLTGGVIGLVSSIIVLLVFIAIFVIAVVMLARPHLFRGRSTGTSTGRSSLRGKRTYQER